LTTRSSFQMYLVHQKGAHYTNQDNLHTSNETSESKRDALRVSNRDAIHAATYWMQAAAHYNTLQHTATHSCTAFASFFFEKETSSRDVSPYTKRDARHTFERMLDLLLKMGFAC